MKIISYSLFRALFAIAIGAMLIKYREEMVTWMTIVIGILFFFSGVFAIIMAYARKRAAKALLKSLAEAEIEEDVKIKKPSTKLSSGAIIAGIGSMILGTILAVMPETFVEYLVYILAAFLLLGAIQQFFTLATARSFGAVGFGWWIMPLLLFCSGCVALFKPSVIASFPLLFIGVCMIVYGLIECANSFKSRKNRVQAERFNNLTGKPDFSDAEEVAFEEVKK